MKFGGWFRLEDLQLEDQRLDVFEAVAFCMLKASIKQFASTQLWHTGVVPFTVQLRMTQHDTILVCRGTLVRQLLSPSFFFPGGHRTHLHFTPCNSDNHQDSPQYIHGH